MSEASFEFFDERALFERLSTGVRRTGRPIILLLGSAITAPPKPKLSGVPNVSGIIKLIKDEFDGTQLTDLEAELDGVQNPYQSAFKFLIGRRGQQVANDIIRRSVWSARKHVVGTTHNYVPSNDTSDEFCRVADQDIDGWLLTPAVEAIGHLIARYPERFGKAVLTTNFDPLIQVSIERAGDHTFRTVLHRDGNLAQTEGSGCHVIHLHGYWHGADTLHTPRQLAQPRPRLKASLASLIRGKTLVVCGYGGWDDVFTDALVEIVLDDSQYPEIIWTLNSPKPIIPDRLAEKLAPGVDRGRVNFYTNVNCHEFFPALLAKWYQTEVPERIAPRPRINRVFSIMGEHRWTVRPIPVVASSLGNRILPGNEEDRPPLVDFCVGRDSEINQLLTSQERVCFISGLGGQGKSTLVARYFSESQSANLFNLYVWRDCKEEGERFETKLVSIVEGLSEGKILGSDIVNAPIYELAQLLLLHAGDRKVLFVFDNVDHYVDLENSRLSAPSNAFVEHCLTLGNNCKFVFTCRPTISYPGKPILTCRVGGLSRSAAVELFANRGAACSTEEIDDAHLFTQGHAFWLDLLAAQVAKKGTGARLTDLVTRPTSGKLLPDETLWSIWKTLNEREQVVLRALAESVRPETEDRLADYLRNRMRFNKLAKALRSLRSLNLIVIKPQYGSPDLIELHPLVREFIRLRFPLKDRMSFIDDIIKVYQAFFGIHKAQLQQRPRLNILQNWTEGAELDIEAGKHQQAFELLTEVRSAFRGSAYPNEFVRVATKLFESVSWEKHSLLKGFDPVLESLIHTLVDLGRFSDADRLLGKFEGTLSSKDVRYILYCDLRCNAAWAKSDFQEAIKWGQRGLELRTATNVDTAYNTAHTLALAQRDSGEIDAALKYFLLGRQIAEVIDPDELDDEADGSYYGNIGRCLHLMGQIDPAIICYRKSAVLIERDLEREHVINQGFIRKWIGELLLTRDQPCLAKTFLEAARKKWESVSPHRAEAISRKLSEILELTANCADVPMGDLERFCVAWIYGRDDEFRSTEGGANDGAGNR